MAKYLACIKTSTRHGCKWGFQNMIFELIIEEEKKIHEDSLRKVEEEKKQCDELSAQKAAMVNSLKKLTEDTARLMEKMQG